MHLFLPQILNLRFVSSDFRFEKRSCIIDFLFSYSVQETSRVSPTRTASLDKTPSQSGSGKSCVLEGISDSPLKPYRQRSSTVSGAGGDSMRKELIAKKAKKQLETEKNIETKSNEVQRNSGPKMNM